jgi:GNAT superfamily N-acetyltransferase
MEKIIPKSGLNSTELVDIRDLAEQVNQWDGIDLKMNWEMLNHRPDGVVNDFFYVADNRCVGYLGLYSFNEQEFEVQGMVDPKYRRKGIFRQLVSAARREASQRNRIRLLFICERLSLTGTGFVVAQGFSYQYSEYRMQLLLPSEPAPLPNRVALRLASREDLPELDRQNALYFGGEPEDMMAGDSTTERAVNDYSYLAEVDGRIVGKADLLVDDDRTALLYGFGVLPEYRRHGYGREIIQTMIHLIHQRGLAAVNLEVATENKSALTIYKNCGFQESRVYDYYELKL